MSDTIVAVATAPGAAAVAVVRISGPDTRDILRTLGAPPPKPRRATLAALKDADGQLIDRGLTIFFPAPNSYTGEDVAELQLHGGRIVVDHCLEAVLAAGARLAEPGEFTRRAFETGKLALDEVEAVADLIAAQSEAQARQALSQLQGDLGRRYLGWRERLISVLARLEAAVDFPDEDLDIEATGLRGDIVSLRDELALALAKGVRGLQVRDGYRVALIGAPNAGKSTLFNRLLAREAAIVTPRPGTTRDVLEASLDIAGFQVLLADMAGLRESSDEIEQEGVRRARAWAQTADLRIWVVDRSASGEGWREGLDLVQPGDICLMTKTDLPEGRVSKTARDAAGRLGLTVIDAALPDAAEPAAWLVSRVTVDLGGAETPAITRRRHQALLEAAVERLAQAAARLDAPELAAEDLRLAARELERVQGRVGAEDVLDEIFSSFCIGK